ncbi:hypothetical protein [Amycolatopsis jiangsuensis]|uniref:Glycosyltransferase RgtA/B/C/D-like domain-containing protein n=1 Tax=Amycolatopsis jiangsuensis TaxID=1181879 RepID=A0A840IRD1_9PSEU|nr:hypothetical protein [Amycolatopsis jiangsuensis]MBB4684450.1 hypothetical protein [Amycolatopsis jiangsuensis]
MSLLLTRPEPTVAAGPAPHRWRWLSPLLCVVAVVLYVLFLAPVDPSELGSIGLIAALNPAVLAAFVLLSAAFVVEVRAQRRRAWLLLLMTVLAVVGMYGLPTITEPVARLPVSWLHAGWADYIGTHGEVLHNFDARFSWPAFFAVVAWLTDLSGIGNPEALLAWAPPVLTGLAAIGVHAVATAVLGRGRVPWLAAWLFLCVNWVEQDYFSPQGLAFLLYLGALALVLRWLCGDVPPRSRIVASFGLVLLLLALAPAHQVTPFAFAAILAVLTVTRKLRVPWLLAVAILTPLTWLVLGAGDYWVGHLHVLTGGIGDLSGAVQENVQARVAGDPGRITVLGFRFGLVGLLGVLAAAGWWGLRTPRGRPIALGVAAVVPAGLVALQSYGGEMLLRSYLYSLPLLCTLGGAALDRWLRSTRARKLATAVVVVVLGAASVVLVGARGGNDSYVAFRASDRAVVAEAYRLARPGQRIALLTAYAPLDWSRVGEVKQGSLERTCEPGPAAGSCVRRVGPDFLVLNRAQDNYGVTLLGLPAGWTRQVDTELVSSGAYREQLRIGDSVLLVHRSGGTR